MSDLPTPPEENAIRPIVRVAGASNHMLWLFGGALVLGGFMLFSTLNARRVALTAATAQTSVATEDLVTAPPPLKVPPDYEAQQPSYPESAAQSGPPLTIAPALAVAPQPQVITRVVERTVPSPSSNLPLAPQQPFYAPPRAPLVIERPPSAPQPVSGDPTAQNERVMAGRLANPTYTVPQGSIIAAVLETALDSTRAGAVRAIVSRDVRGFDGVHILIPRGSLLYGEYSSDLSAGQKRALVRWKRLTRPDAVIINLDSPAADPLGRAGISGKVDSHFGERFGGAILQSALDVGAAVATRSIVDYPVLVALPGGAQQLAGRQQARVTPTLKVQQGTSVSVFIARDLDFSTVER